MPIQVSVCHLSIIIGYLGRIILQGLPMRGRAVIDGFCKEQILAKCCERSGTYQACALSMRSSKALNSIGCSCIAVLRLVTQLESGNSTTKDNVWCSPNTQSTHHRGCDTVARKLRLSSKNQKRPHKHSTKLPHEPYSIKPFDKIEEETECDYHQEFHHSRSAKGQRKLS